MERLPADELHDVVRRAHAGDKTAFSEIVRVMQNAVVGYAWSVLSDYGRAEDAAQEAFLEAYLRLSALEHVEAFGPWLRAITLSKCHRMVRTLASRRERAGLGDEAANATDGTTAATDPRAELDLRRDVSRAIERLSEAERGVVTLFYLADMDQRAIGQFLEVPVSTVKNRLLSARRRLREDLMTDFEDRLRATRPSRDDRFEKRVEWFRAVDANDVRAVASLLERDRSLLNERRRRDEDPPPGVRWGVTALHLAARNGHADVARALIDAGADLEARDRQFDPGDDSYLGGTPLHWAANWGQFEVVELLVEAGANVNPEQDTSGDVQLTGSTLALLQDRRIAEYLVEHGHELTIFAAVTLAWAGQVRRLVASDPSVLTSRATLDFTPLHLAASKDLPDMVDLLVELGAPLALIDNQARTPTDVALLRGHRRAYERFEAHGVPPSERAGQIAGSIDVAEYRARFYWACARDLATAERMLEVDPSLATARLPTFWEDNYVGGTALHLAAAFGHFELAELLLRLGADRSLKDERYGGTPVDWAKEYDRPDMVAFLER